jgi:cytoskeletal protein RodZ
LHEALAARLTTSPLIPTTLPDPWPGLLKAMTETEPGQRPTAAEVVETLTSGRQLPPFDAGPPPPSPEWYPVEERSHRGLWLLLAVVAFAAIIAGGGYFLLAGHANTPPPVSPGNTPEPHVSTAATTHKHHASASRTAGGAVQPVPHRTARPAHRTATHAAAPSQQTATTPATSPTPTSTPTSPSPSPPPSTSNPPTTSPPPTP